MIITCACGTVFSRTGRGRPPKLCVNCRDKIGAKSPSKKILTYDEESFINSTNHIKSPAKFISDSIVEVRHGEGRTSEEIVETYKDLMPAAKRTPNDCEKKSIENLNNIEFKRTLHCEIGDHDWLAPVQRGRPPRNCPEHAQTISKPAERTNTTNHQRELLRKILENPAAASCNCGVTEETSPAELRAIVSCSEPHHICSVLDSCRRAMGM